MKTGNKGEWSEFYAFVKLLIDRKLFAADPNLQALAEKYFSILKIVREEARNGKKSYDVTGPENIVKIFDAQENLLDTVDVKNLKSGVISIFNGIKNSDKGTFGIEKAEDILTQLQCREIKAKSNQKSDLFLIIHDRISPTLVELGFSIKSMLGSPSTLLNASGGTNFVYNIEGSEVKEEEINSIEGKSKIRDRLAQIKSTGGKLTFLEVESPKFRQNLKKIDTVLPEILSQIIQAYYQGMGTKMSDLVKNLDKNELLEKYNLSHEDYIYKIKNFLVATALGMTAQTEWDGFTKAQGGYIVVKEDGEIVAYHLYNRDEFQDYLFNTTRLDTPSTSRHGFGALYVEENSRKIKLNLQIRFVR